MRRVKFRSSWIQGRARSERKREELQRGLAKLRRAASSMPRAKKPVERKRLL